MLAREYKLRGEESFDEVKTKGKKFQSENFGVSILKRDDQGKPRFGFVISKKISKLAVHRNRIGRAFNEAIRQNMLIIPGGYDFVFLVKTTITNKTVEEIMLEIKEFLGKQEYKRV